MARNLKGRLARMRELGLVKASDLGSGGIPDAPATGGRHGSILAKGENVQPERVREQRQRPSFLEGWERIGDYAWSRILFKPDILPGVVDLAPFRFRVRRTPSSEAAGAGRTVAPSAGGEGERIDSDRLRFFDFETTGLSGGTGTLAFLAAVARRDADRLSVRQFFIEDYPGERAFLSAVLEEFDQSSIIVTYNGSSFDLPLLRTRCIMNGILPPSPQHVDVLFAARRLWKRVYGGASLGLLEREVLGVERENDVPGALIPGLYFSYLKTGDEPLMNAIMSHNADDVASLASLMVRASLIFSKPKAYTSSSSIDRTGLGRSLIAVGRREEGEELLEAALGDGDERSGLILSSIFGKEGRDDDRRRILGLLPDSYKSHLERAKFAEHRERNFKAALSWARKAHRLAPNSELADALDTRIARLKRRAEPGRMNAGSARAGRRRP